ncbi:hypothetical protein PFISCL1PPCAC_13483, partial [Pristionchus fissidentatus]
FNVILRTYPIVQLLHICIVSLALPPVVILLSQLSKIALHDNCKFLIFAWASAFLACVVMHCAYIACDLIPGNYLPQNNHHPHNRWIIEYSNNALYLFFSIQELLLSLERALSCVSPVAYHNKGLSKNNIAIACCFSNTIDILSLVCLSATSYYVSRRKKHIIHSSLIEKYQVRIEHVQVQILSLFKIKEAFDITRVMLPCGAISLFMKVSSSMAAWVYALDMIESKYMFTLTGGAYFIIESLNCMICSTILLTKHEGLRK